MTVSSRVMAVKTSMSIATTAVTKASFPLFPM
jgi:hypothetical protein